MQRLRSNQSARLWFNGAPQPFIDGWVKSANDNEFRGSAYLLGGRSYALNLQFTKATYGVDDTDKSLASFAKRRLGREAFDRLPVRIELRDTDARLPSADDRGRDRRGAG